MSPRTPLLRPCTVVLTLAASMLGGAAVLFLFSQLIPPAEVQRLLATLDAGSPWSAAAFVVAMAAVVVLLLPGAPFTLGAGFVFGLVAGSVYVVVGTTLGATLAFLIARRFLSRRAAAALRRHPRMRLLDAGLTLEGWKVVLLSRLIPFFPSKLANYFFGATSVSLRGFVVGSALGFVPFTVHSVYLGAIAARITGASVAEDQQIGVYDWIFYASTLLLVAAIVLYLNRLAWRLLAAGQDAQAASDAGVARTGPDTPA